VCMGWVHGCVQGRVYGYMGVRAYVLCVRMSTCMNVCMSVFMSVHMPGCMGMGKSM